MTLTTQGLEQRINHLRGRLQMFGDMPDLKVENSVELRFFSMKQRLPGLGFRPEVGQVRITEKWPRDGAVWLVYYLYDYDRLKGHPLGAGLYGFHLHAFVTGGRPVLHLKVVDGRRRDPHYIGGAITVDAAIDFFFRLDASEQPIDSRGLTPIFPERGWIRP